MMLHVAQMLAFGLSIVVAMPTPAQPLTGVLKRIKESGEITLGHRDASVPFSYLDDKQQPVGYSMDLCLRVVDAVKAELKLPALKVIYNPVTSANRIPLIANGTIELECGSTVNNVERQAQVAFSDTTFIVSTRFIAKRESNLKTLADLRGKTVVCTAGTNTLARVNGLNQKQNLGMIAVELELRRNRRLELRHQLVCEARARDRDVRVFEDVGHPPGAVVVLDERVLLLDARGIGVLGGRDAVADHLEHVRVRRQREHAHHETLDARCCDETVGRMLQVVEEIAEEQRLAVLLQADDRVELRRCAVRYHRSQEIDVRRWHFHGASRG